MQSSVVKSIKPKPCAVRGEARASLFDSQVFYFHVQHEEAAAEFAVDLSGGQPYGKSDNKTWYGACTHSFWMFSTGELSLG